MGYINSLPLVTPLFGILNPELQINGIYNPKLISLFDPNFKFGLSSFEIRNFEEQLTFIDG